MIPDIEIREDAREWSLRAEVVEKDYVLGWVLSGIAQNLATNAWIFKGGTCLKKCYFETYRFSEDLDFTIPADKPFDPKVFTEAFESISAWVYEQSGVELPKDGISFESYKNPRGRDSMLGKISYRGPLQPKGALPRIKLDLTQDEVVVTGPVARPIAHPYTDALPTPVTVRCYSFPEVFGEKLRALAERQLPRDLYDVVNIYHQYSKPDPAAVRAVLQKKCEFKGIPFPSVAEMERHPRHGELTSEWTNMLAHQLPPPLPPTEHYWSVVTEILQWVEGKMLPVPMTSIRVQADTDTAWRPAPTVTRWGLPIPLETVRYAGVNRLCVALMYRKQGAYPAQQYVIEPYSLRRTREGRLVLYGVRADIKKDRAFRVDRIERVELTGEPFAPRYRIEFGGTV
ncbi:MAG: nucleotidyl transferase AbiEii/AbiGii toxin family protein [Elusimicrobiota bacterium]